MEVNIEAGNVYFNCEHDTYRLKVISSLMKWSYPISESESKSEFKLGSTQSKVSCIISRNDNINE